MDKACSVQFDTCCHANRVNHAGEYLHHSVPKHSDIISTLCVSFKKDLPPDCAYEHLSLIFFGSVLSYLFTYLHFSIKHSRLPHPVPTPTGHLLHQGMLGSLKQTD